jgi:Resolvase, N terminal domain
MNSANKIQRAHVERLAIVYVRQSSLAQVYGHTESTARQYALADEATRLGWEASRIVVIDADLGISGRTASARMGFRELVGRVCVGEVGAIFGLEVSRLARSTHRRGGAGDRPGRPRAQCRAGRAPIPSGSCSK